LLASSWCRLSSLLQRAGWKACTTMYQNFNELQFFARTSNEKGSSDLLDP